MSELFETYEQEYCEQSAAIKREIATMVNLPADKRRQAMARVEKNIEFAEENLKNMEMEALSVPTQRDKLKNRLQNYKNDMITIKRDLKKAKAQADNDARNRLLEGGSADELATTSADHRQRLLESTRRLEGSGEHISRSLKIADETEQIGIGILTTLGSQREQIERARDGLRETNANIKRSRRTISSMARRVVTNKLIMILIILGLLATIGIILFFILYPIISKFTSKK